MDRKLVQLYESMYKEDTFSNYSFDESLKLMREKFPWTDELVYNSSNMSNFNYYPEEDELVFSIAYMPDHVRKSKALEVAKEVFPKIKIGMDFKNVGIKEYEDPNNTMRIIGQTIRSYDISMENVSTGYWDLVMTVHGASEEPPNKLIRAFDVFRQGVEYLSGEEDFE